MLDAAHGEGVGAVVRTERLNVGGCEAYEAGIAVAGCVRRRRPVEAAGADILQGSRFTAAGARSRSELAVAETNAEKNAFQ